MRNLFLLLAVMVSWVGLARADDPAAPVEERAPPTTPTTVEGRAIDLFGKPIANARVHVLPHGGKRIETKTDADGRFRVEVTTTGPHNIGIAIDGARSFRTVDVQAGIANKLETAFELDRSGGEVIRIDDERRPTPKVDAKSTVDPRINLPYSDEAISGDVWARAWLLLDIDERGTVTRLKLLKPPGHGLDKIAVEAAFALTFEPALGGDDRPMKTYKLWTYEWPAWGYMIKENGSPIRRNPDHHDVHMLGAGTEPPAIRGGSTPVMSTETYSPPLPKNGTRGAYTQPFPNAFHGALDRVPCTSSRGLDLDKNNRVYRDCSKPDLSKVATLPWITRDTIEVALAPLKTSVKVEGTRKSPWLAYAMLGVTAVTAGYTVWSFREWHGYQERIQNQKFLATSDPEEYRRLTDKRDTWERRALLSTAGALVGGVATYLLWNRRGSSEPVLTLETTGQGTGVAATYSGAW